ncbi:MAG: nicotinamide mononucleotide transporter [Clostridia bacterium]|nr:nicotinamide mononucleotide transporter [Clostridia bacterium]
MLRKIIKYFSLADAIIWCSSVVLILLSYFIFRGSDALSLTASLIGVTALLLCAKGHPAGQVLVIIFSFIYAVISYSFSYYGEMLTYLGMSMPMAVLALISWIKNPYEKGKAEVRVNRLPVREIPLFLALTVGVTVIFYFILAFLGTANLFPSTLSVTTSFAAVYLTFRRSPYYAVAYALNDLVLILLWSLASIENTEYLTVVFCFVAFLVNDLYGFISWRKMEKRQSGGH